MKNTKRKIENRFNDLSSKEWLPFQKSWFKFIDLESLYNENIRFFTKSSIKIPNIYYYGTNQKKINNIPTRNNFNIVSEINDYKNEIQFAIYDLLELITEKTTVDEYYKLKEIILESINKLYSIVEYRKFIAIFIPNITKGKQFLPFAWDIAKSVSSIISLKDEKICCIDDSTDNLIFSDYFNPSKKLFYCLYFRKEDENTNTLFMDKINFFNNNIQCESGVKFKNNINSYFILKPKPRKKDEILHPAKFPEELVEMFVSEFSLPTENIFDPMCGTGSTIVGSMNLNRNGYGTELSNYFANIAINRCNNVVDPNQQSIFQNPLNVLYKILNKNANDIQIIDFPKFHYIFTSPPYWNMLNMKGAENQAKRIEKGLQTNYSDDENDLGNVENYEDFLRKLSKIYFNIIELLESKRYITIVVKNIKKEGKNYPFAWDLANILSERLTLLPECFWLQDDISIAPYGYGNTWVSNTFHQYCLTFQKP